MSKSWPTTPLAAAQRAFTLLTLPPTMLVFDCRGRAGLPQRILPVDELKRVLIADTTPHPARSGMRCGGNW